MTNAQIDELAVMVEMRRCRSMRAPGCRPRHMRQRSVTRDPDMVAEKKAGREGQVSFTFWTDPDLRDDIKMLAVEKKRPVQDLMEEAARDLLVKYKKKPKKS
jgi:hypothetical protein